MPPKPTILFEDELVLAVSKPAGLSVHGDGRTTEPTLSDWVLTERPALAEVGEPLRLSSGEIVARPGIVHRLDKETSGVMLIAKTQESYLFLKRQFKNHEVKKRYHAFVYGATKDDRGTINAPIGRSAADFRRRTTAHTARGEVRKAVTRWHVVLRGEGATFLEAQPLTGRTHQIRVHFKSIGHPVVCDALYAPKRPPMFGFTRLALHAKAITFRRPGGAEETVEAPYPADFEAARKAFLASGAEPVARLRTE